MRLDTSMRPAFVLPKSIRTACNAVTALRKHTRLHQVHYGAQS